MATRCLHCIAFLVLHVPCPWHTVGCCPTRELVRAARSRPTPDAPNRAFPFLETIKTMPSPIEVASQESTHIFARPVPANFLTSAQPSLARVNDTRRRLFQSRFYRDTTEPTSIAQCRFRLDFFFLALSLSLPLSTSRPRCFSVESRPPSRHQPPEWRCEERRA